MTTKHTPATPLPWTAEKSGMHTNPWISGGPERKSVAHYAHKGDADYIAHAANLYGPLVEAVRALDPNHPVLKQAGEVPEKKETSCP